MTEGNKRQTIITECGDDLWRGQVTTGNGKTINVEVKSLSRLIEYFDEKTRR
jgi:hypothetical protein